MKPAMILAGTLVMAVSLVAWVLSERQPEPAA
jgi:hypothetical protein